MTHPRAEELAADLALALRMADTADALTMARFGAGDLIVETKPDLTPVSEADRAAERALRDMLGAERPSDGVVGEEYGEAPGSAGSDGPIRQWILDPIDGTKNYVRGVPVWATLIALTINTEPVVGVVSAPALSRRWWAARGHGAHVLDPRSPQPRALRVSGVSALGDASFSYSDHHGWAERGALESLTTLTAGTWRQRAYGDFWSHMMVAEGVVDIAAEPQLESYDMAALLPVITEAGGRATGYDGSPALAARCLLTTNGLLHDEVLTLMRPGGS